MIRIRPVHLLASAAVLWAGALPAAAAAAARPGVLPWLSVLIYGIGSMVCHQRPERSFVWGAATWPVCARCAGIYLGAASIALLAFLPGPRIREAVLGDRVLPAQARIWFGAAAIPTVLTLVFEWATGITPSNVLRAGTGAVLGAAVLWILLTFVGEETPDR